MNSIIPINELRKLPPAKLRALKEEADIFLLKVEAREGEDYHVSFKRDPKLFKKFLKQVVQMQDNMYAYFLDQKSRIYSLVYLSSIKAADKYDTYFNQIQWEYENQTLSGILELDISKFFDMGIAAAEIELKIDQDISSKSTPQAEFIRDYSLRLAGNLNNTTINRIKQQIKTSIDLNETTPQLADRLGSILDNAKRADMIAQTESVRAFTHGRLQYGEALGWKGKEWRTVPGACPICAPIPKLGIIPINKPFKVGKVEVMGAPAHPRCRCGVKIHKTVEGKAVDQSPTIDPFSTFEDFVEEE